MVSADIQTLVGLLKAFGDPLTLFVLEQAAMQRPTAVLHMIPFSITRLRCVRPHVLGIFSTRVRKVYTGW